MAYLKYCCAFLIPLVVIASIYLEGYYTFIAITFVFGFLPLLELFTKADTENMDVVEEAVAKEDSIYDLLLYALVGFQIFVLGFFLYRVGDTSLQLHEIVGMITAYGVACGLSINNAHELGHRNTKFERFLSKTLLLTSLYMHFYIEHNRGHHLNVATDEDPASSKYGESIYAFYLRSISGCWISAWKLEKVRMEKLGHPNISLHNEMLRFQLLQIALLTGIGIVFGLNVMLYFFLGAFIGILMLETVNYIEHYGLRREKKGKRYERTLPIHSWNSNHPIGRMILLELSRHSDHHYIANRKYQLLRHFDESPQMPTGYPGMMLLTLIPPLWFRVMHKQIDHYQSIMKSHADPTE